MLIVPFLYKKKKKIMMNIIIWNCKGALKPSFKKRVGDLVQNHNPAILVVMETHVGGD